MIHEGKASNNYKMNHLDLETITKAMTATTQRVQDLGYLKQTFLRKRTLLFYYFNTPRKKKKKNSNARRAIVEQWLTRSVTCTGSLTIL